MKPGYSDRIQEKLFSIKLIAGKITHKISHSAPQLFDFGGSLEQKVWQICMLKVSVHF